MALGESYMDGWWDADHIDQLIHTILTSKLHSYAKPSIRNVLNYIRCVLFNKQSRRKATEVGKKHYDAGNDLFSKMLDKRMTYSCAYWKNASNLDEAQEAKLDLICRKLYLKPGMKVLDIGCGWGSFIQYAAEKYGVEAVGITISQKQCELARERCQGLPITIRFQDYRSLNEKYDRIVSVGQMEHVGPKNYLIFMKTVHRCLNDEGIFLLHTIGSHVTNKTYDPWIEKYIFPNGMIPSSEQLSKAANGLFICEDCQNFGSDYDKTLMAWHENFTKNWESLKKDYDERFYRMWRYYLLTCAGVFRCRNLQLWQTVYVKQGIPGGYTSVR